MDLISDFSKYLLEWHLTIERDLPWKEDKNVFYIWLSEIILQQTRVEQGKPYFLKFKNRFENVHQLANTSDEELMSLWQGLGYYSRARNLHQTAKLVSASGGEFPKTYEGLLGLKGIGPYTAAAIASFAYDLPVPVVDGNVNRVISRLFGITDAIDEKIGKEKIRKSLDAVFDCKSPAEFNQAIMDFGALQCLPKSPNCEDCPFNNVCLAYRNELVNAIPYKAKKIKKTNRTFHYYIAKFGNQYLIKKRIEKGIWKHLHEFVLIEEELADMRQFESKLKEITSYDKLSLIKSSGPHKHVLTHQNLNVYFHILELEGCVLKNGTEYFFVDRENLRKFAVPKIIDWYLAENSIYLKEI